MRNDHRPTVVKRLQKQEQYYEKSPESLLFWKFQFAEPEAAIRAVSRTIMHGILKFTKLLTRFQVPAVGSLAVII